MTDTSPELPPSDDGKIEEPRLWRDNGWTARVIKNDDDEGWAVAMFKDGEAEPALVSPWTMGRDKKNPKPLDTAAFNTLVKTASEVLRRHEQHMHAMLHKKVVVRSGDGEIVVTMDIVAEDESPFALLTARPVFDPGGAPLAEVRVSTSFKLTEASARAWIEDNYRRPR